MTVYLDVLLLSNFWVDYVLLRTTARLTHTAVRPLRMLLGGLLGAVGALAIFLPQMPVLICMIGRLLLTCSMTAAAFGLHSVRHLLRQTAVLYIASLFFCGVIYALSLWKMPVGFYAQNTVVYADLSLLVLLFGATAAAAVSSVFARKSAQLPHRAYQLHLRISGFDLCMPALADTGSTLRDAYSGLPVVVCTKAALHTWLSQYRDAAAAASTRTGFRLIPVRTVAGQTVLPAFQPDYAAIAQRGRNEVPLDILIAISADSDDATPAIVPACCITAVYGGAVKQLREEFS